MPNLPIFSQSNSIKEKSKAPSTPTNLIPNTMPYFFAMPPQMFSFAQNPNINNSSSPQSYSPKQQIPSLDEFFTKLDSTGEFTSFKSAFENERITVDQISDLTDVEFDQLGINKIGWRKAFRTAARRYKSR